MGEYTKIAYVGMVSEHAFGRQLFELVEQLQLPLPYFRGRVVNTNVPGVERWEVRTIMRSDLTTPDFEAVDYTKTYPTWEEGINTAMLDLMSRLCYTHSEDIPENSPFRNFGKRDEIGIAMKTDGDRLNIPTLEKHMEDLEYYAFDMEKRVHIEMTLRDQAKAVIETQTQELQALHTLTGHMEENIHNLQQQNMEKDNLIAALQAQLNPPPPPAADDDGDDDDDDEGGDDNAGNGAAHAHVPEEEEEVIQDISSDEEDTPAMNTRQKKRKCTNSREYFKRFKMWLERPPVILSIVMRK